MPRLSIGGCAVHSIYRGVATISKAAASQPPQLAPKYGKDNYPRERIARA